MRSGRSFLVLCLVAALLGGYIYFVEMERDTTTTSTTTREKVFTVTPGSIEALEITNASGATTAVVKRDTAWTITAPEAADADTVEVSMVASSLESLERTRIVTDAPDAPAAFGLDPARITITFTVAGETTPRRLRLGNRTPTGGDLYAQEDTSPAVFLIAAYLEDTFNKGQFDLRDKSVLKFSRDGADALTITQGASGVRLTKTGNAWRLAAPIAAAADFGTVDGLVGRLFQARMAEFVAADGSANLRTWGLDRPRMIVSVGSGSARAELAIGAANDDGQVYARDLARPLIFTLDQSLVDELGKSVSDFRVKDLFGFRSFTASSFALTSGNTTYQFTRARGEGEAPDAWSMTTPTSKAVDMPRMTDLLTTASNLRAESFVPQASTTGDLVTITVTYDDAGVPKTDTVTFRKTGTTVQATREGEPGAAVVSTVDYDRVISLLQEIAG